MDSGFDLTPLGVARIRPTRLPYPALQCESTSLLFILPRNARSYNDRNVNFSFLSFQLIFLFASLEFVKRIGINKYIYIIHTLRRKNVSVVQHSQRNYWNAERNAGFNYYSYGLTRLTRRPVNYKHQQNDRLFLLCRF